MAESAFIVRVPEAEICVSGLRQRFDAAARLGVPAHITVLFPFMSPEHIDTAVLDSVRGALRETPSFSFVLAKAGQFPTTAYLAPEPATPFIALTESLARQFPAFPPFRDEHAAVVPHLTVANGNAADAQLAAGELSRWLHSNGPIRSRCSGVCLIENSSGLWKEMHAFGLKDSHD